MLAQRAFGRIISGYVEREQRNSALAHINSAVASINDRACADDNAARVCDRFNGFSRRATRRNNVFDHKHALAILYVKAAPQTHSIRFALREKSAQPNARAVS